MSPHYYRTPKHLNNHDHTFHSLHMEILPSARSARTPNKERLNFACKQAPMYYYYSGALPIWIPWNPVLVARCLLSGVIDISTSIKAT